MNPTFREDLERAAQDGTEWKFGKIDTDLALIPLKDRLKYLPYVLVNAVKELASWNERQDARLDAIEARLSTLETQARVFGAIIKAPQCEV